MPVFRIAFFALISVLAWVQGAHAAPLLEYHEGQLQFSIHAGDPNQQSLVVNLTGESCFRKQIFALTKPARLVIDNPQIDGLYGKKISDFESSVLREVRIGRHPTKTRLVLEFYNTEQVVFTSENESGGCRVTCTFGSPSSAASSVVHGVAPVPTPGIPRPEASVPPAVPDSVEETSAFDRSQQVRFSNRSGADISADDNGSSFVNHLLITPQVDIDYENGFSFLAAARLDAYYEDTTDSISQFNVYADDIYATYLGDGYALKVGNQRIRWGKADEVSPLDIVSPEDLQDGLVRRRDSRKIPVPAVNVLKYSGDTELQALFIPWFEESILPEYRSDWSGIQNLAAVAEIKRESTSRSVDDAEYGFQLSRTGDAFDYTFNFLSTTTDEPVLHMLDRQPNAVPAFELRYHRREVIGASFEYAGELIGFRGDLAYSTRKYYQTVTFDAVGSDASEFVVGADYIGEETLYVNLQLGGEYIHQYDPQIAGLDRFSPSLFGEISNGLWRSYLLGGTRMFYNFASEDLFLNPYIVLNYWDWGSFELGVHVLDGKMGTFSRFKDNDQIYLLVECTL